MCRLFGFHSMLSLPVHHSLLAAENALMRQSREHPDGWGIAWYEHGTPRIQHGTAAAFADEDFQRLSSTLAAPTLIAHVRQATVGAIRPENTHPFQCGRWVFAHNGDILGFAQLRPYLLEEVLPHYRARIRGDTDSEHCFYLFLSHLEREADPENPSLDDVMNALAVSMEQIVSWCRLVGAPRRPSVNMLVSNGRMLAATRLGRALYLSTQKHRCSDFTRCSLPSKPCLDTHRPQAPVTHLMIASEPISDEDAWEAIDDNAIVGVNDHMRLTIRQGMTTQIKDGVGPLPPSIHDISIAN